MPTATNGDDDQLAQLLAKLDAIDDEYSQLRVVGDSGWQLRFGPLHLRGYFSSQRIAILYLGFCAGCLLIGGALAVLSSTKELGVALVVGAIFAGGSLIGQWWALQVSAEQYTNDQVHGAQYARYLRALMRRRNKLVAEVERLKPGYFDDE